MHRPFSRVFRLQNEYLLYTGTWHTISLILCCLALYHTGRLLATVSRLTADAHLTKTVRLNRLSVLSLGRLYELTVARRKAR